MTEPKHCTGHCSLWPNLFMISTAYSLTFQQPVAEPKKPTQGINLSDPICLCSPLFKHPPFNSQWKGQKTTQDIVLSHLIYPCSPLLKHPLFNSLWQGLALTQSVYALHYSNTHLSTACDNQKTTQDIILSHLICPCSPLFKHPFFNSLWQGKKKPKKTGHCSLWLNLSMLSTVQTSTFQQPVTVKK